MSGTTAIVDSPNETCQGSGLSLGKHTALPYTASSGGTDGWLSASSRPHAPDHPQRVIASGDQMPKLNQRLSNAISSRFARRAGVISGQNSAMHRARLFTALTLSISPALASAQVYSDSIADFAGTQGRNGWFYGYYRAELNPTGFTEFPLFNVWWEVVWSRTANQSGGYWTCVGANDLAHPQGLTTSGGRVPEVNWAARRWISN